MTDIYQNLKNNNLSLPSASSPVGAYVMSKQEGSLLYTSGHIPFDEAGQLITGRVGKDLSTEQAYQVAQRIALQLLATIEQSIGDLNKIREMVKVTGFVQCTESFKDHAKVLNGASELFAMLLGDKGKAARSAVGVYSLPLEVPVEIEAIIAI